MISYFVRHPVAANLLMGLICFLGISVIGQMKREAFPVFPPSSVAVSVAYPGASAREVDESICGPLEGALNGVTGLIRLECLSREGGATATAELVEGGDITQFYNDIFSIVSGMDSLPEEAEPPVVEAQSEIEFLAFLAVSGIASHNGLVAYTSELTERILAISGVATATVSGITDREIRVEYDDTALRRYGLSGQDVANAVRARSLSQPLGAAQLREGALILRFNDTRRSISALQDLIVMESHDGAVTRLGDLATISMTDTDENVVSFIDGERAAIISITKTAEADSVRVFAAVDALLEEERAAYPDPFALTVTYNTSDEIEARLGLILWNIVLGLALVLATMWLFSSLREALWISATLPVSFLGTMYVMQMSGISINMISLIALLMAVGLIMDDSIVIAENIGRWRRRAEPYEAATKGVLEVLPGVLSSFLTTACVFGPLIFIAGDIGQIMRLIPLVLLITLAISLVEGFLILPRHISHSAGAGRMDQEDRRATRCLNWLRDVVVIPIARLLTRYRFFTLGCTLAVLILSVGLVASGTVRIIAVEQEEGQTIEARVALTSGIARERTVATVERILGALDEVDARFTPDTVGGVPLVESVLVQYGINQDVNDNGSHTATITVDLLGIAKRKVHLDEVLEAWRVAAGPIPDLVQSSFTRAADDPSGQAIEVELYGRDLGTLEDAAADLLLRLARRDDVAEVYQDFYGGRPELHIALSTYGYAVGLTPEFLSAQLRHAFQGAETDNFRVGASSVTVRVQLDDVIDNLSEIELFPVTLPSGQQIALSAIADFRIEAGYSTITRRNGRALARVIGSIDHSATTAAEFASLITREFGPELMRQYPGIEVSIGGEAEELEEGQDSIVQLFLTGLAGVYLILAFQFRSYVLPLVVMIAIPFALIGSIGGHWVMGLDISMSSMIGFVSLAGIVVNNSILYLTFFQTHLHDEDYVSASILAVQERFRPVVLSTMTTFAGLLPIIFDTSPEVATLVPLVVAVAFGLLASMTLILLVFPSVLSIYFDLACARTWQARFEREAVETA